MIVLAVDPGSRKCGVALVCSQRGILAHVVVPVGELGTRCQQLVKDHGADVVIIGGSTGSRHLRPLLENALQREVAVVDERHSTEDARGRYFRDNPPRGLWRLVPLGLQLPSVPYDDYAAVVLAERYISEREQS